MNTRGVERNTDRLGVNVQNHRLRPGADTTNQAQGIGSERASRTDGDNAAAVSDDRENLTPDLPTAQRRDQELQGRGRNRKLDQTAARTAIRGVFCGNFADGRLPGNNALTRKTNRNLVRGRNNHPDDGNKESPRTCAGDKECFDPTPQV